MEESKNKELNEQETQEKQEEEERVDSSEVEDGGDEKSPEVDLASKLKECEDKYLRAYADFENTKKRLEKEKYVALDYAYEKFAQELLPALDSLEAALNAINSSEENETNTKIKEGLLLTQEQFLKVFNKHGISKIGIEEGFNPHLHEAVMNVDSKEHDEGEIVQILQTGYKYKERVLRPALVSICKK